MERIMATGENIMRLGSCDLIVSRRGNEAMTWGDRTISSRFPLQDLPIAMAMVKENYGKQSKLVIQMG